MSRKLIRRHESSNEKATNHDLASFRRTVKVFLEIVCNYHMICINKNLFDPSQNYTIMESNVMLIVEGLECQSLLQTFFFN